MHSLLMGTVLAIAAQGAPGKTYEHFPSNLKFTLAGPSKFAKKKGDWILTFPAGSGKGQATLEIFAVSFMAHPDVWEITQKYFVEQQRMNLLLQTREEILGVPLLLAKMQETATTERKITLSGLIYAASDFKFAFRLTAPEDHWPDAESKWRETMLTLATIDGQLPVPETPNRKSEVPASKNKPVRPPENNRTTIGSGGAGAPMIVLGEVAQPCTTAGKKVVLRAPKGWTLAAEGDATVTASHPEFGVPIRFTVASTLDSPSMQRALAAAARQALERFQSVRLREESLPKTNAAGAVLVRILREGTTAEGAVVMIQAGGEKGDYYWLAEVALPARPGRRQAELLDALLHGASVEPAP